MPLLSVRGLKTFFRTGKGWLKAVNDISLDIRRGDTLGIVGESGCGKTTVALSIMGVLPTNAKIVGGEILFENLDLLKLDSRERRNVRWEKISMIFQAAMNALNPVYKVGDQLVDVYRTHKDISKGEAKRRVAELFELVGLDSKRMDNYPHEFSGGMKQRAVIAMSLLCNPSLIIADEPTTALDVVVQDQILKEIKDLQRNLGFSMIVISHDISVIAETCDHVLVMYGGRNFETGDTISILKNSYNPYTVSLMKSFPSVRGPLKALSSIPGTPPDLVEPPSGCLFSPRCPLAEEKCFNEPPPLIGIKENHHSLCHFPDEANKLIASTG